MMKKPKTFFSGTYPFAPKWVMKTAKIGIALEVLTFAGGYGVYHQMNNNPGMCDSKMKQFFCVTDIELLAAVHHFSFQQHSPTI